MKPVRLFIIMLVFTGAGFAYALDDKTPNNQSIILLQRQTDPSLQCFGVIIDKSNIITTAECLDHVFTPEIASATNVHLLSGIEYGVAYRNPEEENTSKLEIISFKPPEKAHIKKLRINKEPYENTIEASAYGFDDTGLVFTSPVSIQSCNNITCEIKNRNDQLALVSSSPILNEHGDICMLSDDNHCSIITKSVASPPAPACHVYNINNPTSAGGYSYYHCDPCYGQYDRVSREILPNCTSVCEFSIEATPSFSSCVNERAEREIVGITIAVFMIVTLVAITTVIIGCYVKEKAKRCQYRRILSNTNELYSL